MRTFAIIVTATLALLGAGVGAGGCVIEEAQSQRLAAEQELAAQWAQVEPRVSADWERWKDDALFAARDGGDAAALLFAHVRWMPADSGTPLVPRELSEQMRSYDGGWAAHAEELAVQDITLDWMRELGSAGYWDLEPADGPFKDQPFKPYTQPVPNFVDAQNIARVRLVQGLRSGDAREAAREVRELARLCMTTESVAGELVGLALLSIERTAHAEAVRRGHDVSGWQPFSAADTDQLKAGLWAAQAPYSLLATGALAKVRPPIGDCSGVHTGLSFAGFVQAHAADLLPERYAGLKAKLDESPCRLTRLRGFWASPTGEGQLKLDARTFCLEPDGTRAANCHPPGWLGSLPLARVWAANRVMTSRRAVNELGYYLPDAGMP